MIGFSTSQICGFKKYANVSDLPVAIDLRVWTGPCTSVRIVPKFKAFRYPWSGTFWQLRICCRLLMNLRSPFLDDFQGELCLKQDSPQLAETRRTISQLLPMSSCLDNFVVARKQCAKFWSREKLCWRFTLEVEVPNCSSQRLCIGWFSYKTG